MYSDVEFEVDVYGSSVQLQAAEQLARAYATGSAGLYAVTGQYWAVTPSLGPKQHELAVRVAGKLAATVSHYVSS